MIVETFGFKPGQGSAAQGLGYEKEVAPTLNTSSSCGGGVLVKTKTYALGVAENCQESDICSTLRVKEPYGGGEALIVETLVFDEAQITCPTNGLHPKWGGAMPLPHKRSRKDGSNNQK